MRGGKEVFCSCLKCTPKISPHPKHDIHDETHDQAHLHASSKYIGIRTWEKKMVNHILKDGALWHLKSMSTLPKCGRLGHSEKEKQDKGKEKAEDDAVEHHACVGVALSRGTTKTATTAKGIDPLFLEHMHVLLICTGYQVVGAFEVVPVDDGALEPLVVLAVAFEAVPVDAGAMWCPCWQRKWVCVPL
jgi:hypothetical protein